MVLSGIALLDTALAVSAVVLGFGVAVLASRRAVEWTTELASGTRVPRFVIGFTLLAVGTDLPEIANSIVSSVTGHGDLNVGDSVGSAATQVTLVLGLLPIVAGTGFALSRARVSRFGAASVAALMFGMALMADGFLSRLDAVALIVFWVLGSTIVWGRPPAPTQLDLPLRPGGRLGKTAGVLVALGIVGASTLIAVWGLTEMAQALGMPEFVVAFFLASLGTSLPELIVELTALRRQQSEMAIGDAVGSTFVDTTLSIGIGPLIAPVAVTAGLAVRGAAIAAGAVLIVVSVLAMRQRHDWRSGLFFIAVYAAMYAVMAAA